MGARSHPGRIERWIGGGRGRGHHAAGVRVRHGRIAPAARRDVRRGGLEAHLRSRVAVRPDCVRFLARSNRTADANRARCRADARRDRRRRRGGRDERAGGGPRLRRRVDRRYSRHARRRAGADLEQGVDPDVAGAFRASLDALVARGAALVDIDLPHATYATAVYYLVATAEASSNLARYDGVRFGYRAPDDTLRAMYARTRARGFSSEVKRRIMLGTYVLSAGYYEAYYLKAQQVRTLILRDYEHAFERADVVAMPTSPVPAFTLGERIADPLQMYLSDVFTVSANLAGLPAISVPCGFTRERLPIGLQLTGRRFDEATLLKIADAYERDTGWWKHVPGI